MKISVIVPIFNAEKNLEKCISSITNQSYLNLEIILVNDGSTDESLLICNEFKNTDSRIIVIDKVNGGVSSARNEGLEIASGDFIGFVDSDDYVTTDMYEKLMTAAKITNSDVVECGYFMTDENYNILSQNLLKEEVIIGNYNCSYNYQNGINTTNFNWNKLYKASLFMNIRYPNLKFSEDYVVNTKIFFACNIKTTIIDCCYYYVSSTDSVTSQGFSSKKLDIIEAGNLVMHFYNKNYSDLCKYSAIYTLNNIRKLHVEVCDSEITDKDEYKVFLKFEYKKVYSSYKKQLYGALQNKNTILLLWIFNINPNLHFIITKTRRKLAL